MCEQSAAVLPKVNDNVFKIKIRNDIFFKRYIYLGQTQRVCLTSRRHNNYGT